MNTAGERRRGEINLCMHSFEQQVNGKTAKQYKFLPFFTGDCSFEEPLAACGYSQGRDDDLDWEQANTGEKSSSDPWMPSGKDRDTGSGSPMRPSPHLNSLHKSAQLLKNQRILFFRINCHCVG